MIAKPIPGEKIRIAMDHYTAPYWEAAKERRLTACQCEGCGTFRMPPTPFCPKCLCEEVRWPRLGGTGTIFSYTICTRSPYVDVPDFTYVVAIVELDDAPGARLVANLVDIDTSMVEIGLPVAVAWQPSSDGWLIPIFVPRPPDLGARA